MEVSCADDSVREREIRDHVYLRIVESLRVPQPVAPKNQKTRRNIRDQGELAITWKKKKRVRN
jgi:hypothetical protein